MILKRCLVPALISPQEKGTNAMVHLIVVTYMSLNNFDRLED